MKALCATLLGVLVSGFVQAQTTYPDYILLDAEGMSCRQQIQDPTGFNDVDAVKMMLGTIDLQWDGDQEFRMEYMKISLMSNDLSGQRFTRIYSGLDLAYMWMGKPGVVRVAPHSTLSTASSCFVEVGGISLTDSRVPASGTGEILFYGTYRDGKGTKSTVITQPFSFKFDGEVSIR